jgi:hypothetical protein
VTLASVAFTSAASPLRISVLVPPPLTTVLPLATAPRMPTVSVSVTVSASLFGSVMVSGPITIGIAAMVSSVPDDAMVGAGRFAMVPVMVMVWSARAAT